MDSEPRQHDLPPRVREALVLVGQGFTSKEIARRMGDISPHTVNEYIAKGVRTLGAASRHEAARMLASAFIPIPQSLGGEPPDLAQPHPEVLQIAPDRSKSTAWWRRLPFLRNGRLTNDLTAEQRLLWILALSIAIPIVIAWTLEGLQVLQDITRGIFP